MFFVYMFLLFLWIKYKNCIYSSLLNRILPLLFRKIRINHQQEKKVKYILLCTSNYSKILIMLSEFQLKEFNTEQRVLFFRKECPDFRIATTRIFRKNPAVGRHEPLSQNRIYGRNDNTGTCFYSSHEKLTTCWKSECPLWMPTDSSWRHKTQGGMVP